MNFFAEIIINSDAQEIDKPFTYKVPDNLVDKVKKGQLVKVPFGTQRNPLNGFVMNLLYEEPVKGIRYRYISSIVDESPVLLDDDFEIINFIRDEYLCKYIDVIRLLIPTGIMKGVKNKSKSVIIFNKDIEPTFKNYEGYIDIIRFIKDNNGKFTKAELTKEHALSLHKLNKLISLDYLKVEEEVVYRYNSRTYKSFDNLTLTHEQEKAIDIILKSDSKMFLLKGVTGSGKTEVYMRLVSTMLAENKSSIILVPEIALTPQMIERFKGRFGKDVALFHSKLSDGERFDEWQRVKDGKAKIVIGARSALFLPVQNLGLIVIDEEHENTYKSEQNPKYNAKEVAEFLTRIKDCKLILGSATPTIESYYKAISGEYTLLELNNRATNINMPKMNIVDMREELKSGNKSIFSRSLYREIKNRLERKEQIILFLNRRGFSTFVSCRGCGYVFKCHECDISMTYHKSGFLTCHYCGKTEKVKSTCPKCGSKYVKYFGAGTQKVEEEVKRYFKEARVLRMDVDTTRFKNSYELIYNAFKNGEADILIGTQMISKGLDFPNVTLVGVLAADISLNIPDYRSSERTFQIITQVAGRAGRGTIEGEAIVQSYTPEHYSLKFAQEYDYDGFYDEEFKMRAILKYPPFSKILLINGMCKDINKLKDFMNNLGMELEKIVNKEYDITMLGPVPCTISKIKEYYRYQIIFKGEFESEFCKNIKNKLYELNKNVYNDIKVSIDVNPNNLS